MRKPPGRKQKGPFVDDCQPGKYAWCRCSRSGTYPYCDGSHRALRPEDGAPDGSDTTPLKVVFDEPRTVAWCACGASGNKPFCDGSHSRL